LSDDRGNCGTDSGIDVGFNIEIFEQFVMVRGAVPSMDIVTGYSKRCSGLGYSFTVFLEYKNGIVGIIAVVHRDVFIG
jgi:hypothetical protein